MANTFVKLQQMAMKNNWPVCNYQTNQKHPRVLDGYLVKSGPKWCEIATVKRFYFTFTETEIEKEVERTGVRPMSTSYYTDGDGVIHTTADYCKIKIVRCKARKESVKLLFPEPAIITQRGITMLTMGQSGGLTPHRLAQLGTGNGSV